MASPLEGLQGAAAQAEAAAEAARQAEAAAKTELELVEQKIRDGVEMTTLALSIEPRQLGMGQNDGGVPIRKVRAARVEDLDLARLAREGAEARAEEAKAELAKAEGGDIAARYRKAVTDADRGRVFYDLEETIAELAPLMSWSTEDLQHGLCRLKVDDPRPDLYAEGHAEAVAAFARDEVKRGELLRRIRARVAEQNAACEAEPKLAAELKLPTRRLKPVSEHEVEALVALHHGPAEDDRDAMRAFIGAWVLAYGPDSWEVQMAGLRRVSWQDCWKHDVEVLHYCRRAIEFGDTRDAYLELIPQPRPAGGPGFTPLDDAITRKHEPGSIGAFLSS